MASARTPQRDSRVLVLSQRELHAPVHHAVQHELEDVLTEIDDVDLLTPPQVPAAQASRLTRQAWNGSLRRLHAPRRSPPWDRPSMQRTPVTADHDLFFMAVSDPYQLAYLHRVPGWRERCRTAVCLLTEVWSGGVARDADYLRLLAQFDAVLLATPEAGPALQRLGAPAPRLLPMACDVLAFSPLPAPPERTVDLFAYGRNAADVHRQALATADERRLHYLHDTLTAAHVPDSRAHRRQLGGMMQRARYFFAHRINDDPARAARTGGEDAISTRFFEGAAGGAVLLGTRPTTPAFAECFDWPDAVVDLPWEGGDLRAVLDELDADPDRRAAARAAGVRASLLRHDWTHRWCDVLRGVGLAPLPAAEARVARLAEMAELATPDRLCDVQPTSTVTSTARARSNGPA